MFMHKKHEGFPYVVTNVSYSIQNTYLKRTKFTPVVIHGDILRLVTFCDWWCFEKGDFLWDNVLYVLRKVTFCEITFCEVTFFEVTFFEVMFCIDDVLLQFTFC
jgi:hypothetical protein